MPLQSTAEQVDTAHYQQVFHQSAFLHGIIVVYFHQVIVACHNDQATYHPHFFENTVDCI